MARPKSKDIVRELTNGKKTLQLTKIKALKETIQEYLRGQLSQESTSASADATAKEDAGQSAPSTPREATVENTKLEDSVVAQSVQKNNRIEDSSDRTEQMKLNKMKKNIDNISEAAAKSEVKQTNASWGGMFCCASERGDK